jgi:hypothetical protein
VGGWLRGARVLGAIALEVLRVAFARLALALGVRVSLGLTTPEIPPYPEGLRRVGFTSQFPLRET